MKTQKKNTGKEKPSVNLTKLSVDDLVDLMRGTQLLLFDDKNKTQIRLQLYKADRVKHLDDALFMVEAAWECQSALESEENE